LPANRTEKEKKDLLKKDLLMKEEILREERKDLPKKTVQTKAETIQVGLPLVCEEFN
jgi:hypothetical protein